LANVGHDAVTRCDCLKNQKRGLNCPIQWVFGVEESFEVL
jgi:hypothetical protein